MLSAVPDGSPTPARGQAPRPGRGAGWRAGVDVATRLAARPWLWWEAARQAVLLVRPGGRAWLRFRLTTAYGSQRAQPDPADVLAWLQWARLFRRGR
jgi:hypothetical protein